MKSANLLHFNTFFKHIPRGHKEMYLVGISALYSMDAVSIGFARSSYKRKINTFLYILFSQSDCLRKPMVNTWLTKSVSEVFLLYFQGYCSREAVLCFLWVVTAKRMKCWEFLAHIIQHLNIMRLENKTEVLRQMCCGSLINKKRYFFLRAYEKSIEGASGQAEVGNSSTNNVGSSNIKFSKRYFLKKKKKPE